MTKTLGEHGRGACAVVWLLVLFTTLTCGGTGADQQAGSPTAPVEPAGPERTAIFEGLQIHYLDHAATGEGGDHALLLVHGWASTSWTWTRQIPGLTEAGRVLIVDLPGHGRSSQVESSSSVDGYDLDVLADSLVAVLDHAGVGRAVLVGHSNGTPVVLRCYRRHPRRVSALVAVDGSLQNLTPVEMARGFAETLGGEGYRDFVTTMISSMPGDGLAEEDRQGVLDMALSVPQRVMVETLLATVDASKWRDDPIEVPLLALHAEQPQWNQAYESYVRALQPDVEYVVWQGVSHFLMLERPDQFNAAIADFVGRMP